MSGEAVDGWACTTCTYRHTEPTQSHFLSCGLCGALRPREPSPQALSFPVSPQRHDQPSPKRPLADHPSDDNSLAAAAAAVPAETGSALAKGRPEPTDSLSVEVLPSATKPKRRRTINEVLRPQRRAAFASPARYKPGPRSPGRDIPDAELPSVAPLRILRDVLPERLAETLTQQLAASAERWSRGTWYVHGKAHRLSRVCTHFQLQDTDADTAAFSTSRTTAKAAPYCPPQDADDHDVYGRFPTELEAQAAEDGDGLDLLETAPTATPELQSAADIVAAAVTAGAAANAPPWRPTYAFANRYLNGAECVGWHSDHLNRIGPRPVIAGLTLGAARPFKIRRAGGGGESVSVVLPHNSVVVMEDDAQEEWEHAVPRVSDDSVAPHRLAGFARYSLTFRSERQDLPDFGECHCGRPAVLKCKGGKYWISCNPAGTDKPCAVWTSCAWADREALRLRTLGNPK
eukprot:m.132450 g.132450  ORF g.132450 m.132450 type:complete len:460 (-) comp13796_c0_seq1:105-1484(-)